MSNRTPRITLAALALVAATACQAPTLTDDFGLQLVASPVPESVITILNSGIHDSRRVVVRTPDEWRSLWEEATANVVPAPPVPQFDFASEMLLVASMGTRPSGGYSIRIDRVYLAEEVIHAVVRETSPAPSCLVTAALTAPVTAVRIPRVPLASVEFRTTTDEHRCS